MAGIEVTGLDITFPLYHGSSKSLKRTLARMVETRGAPARNLPSAHLGADARERVVVQVLRDISFRLVPGERLGLIGSNGAGKTTLLRALAGIYEPVGGRVVVRGTMGTLLDTNLGMNVDLTGRENIRLRGLFSGLSGAETEAVAEDVQEFADLGGFMDLPVKTYSAGMLVRLAFGLATAVTPQVLLMDEWFLAGDAAFMAKAQERLARLVDQSEILVLSTHQPSVMRAWCTRVIWLQDGRIRMDGTPDAVLDAYLAT